MEHFDDETLLKALKGIRKIAKKAFFLVPNPKSISYLLMRYIRQSNDDWPYGREYLRTDYAEKIRLAGFEDTYTYYMGKAWTKHNFWLAMKDAENFEAYADMLQREILPESEKYLIGFFAGETGQKDVPMQETTDFAPAFFCEKPLLGDDAQTLTIITDLNAERFGLEKKLAVAKKALDEEHGRAQWYAIELDKVQGKIVQIENELRAEKEALESLTSSEELVRKSLKKTKISLEETESSLKKTEKLLISTDASLEQANKTIKEALDTTNKLFETRLFKMLHLTNRLGKQLIKGNWSEKKKFFRWLRAHIKREYYIDKGYNPIQEITSILERGYSGIYTDISDISQTKVQNQTPCRSKPGELRILYVYKWATMGGCERVFLNRAMAFKQQDFNIGQDVYFFHNSGGLKNFLQYIEHFGLGEYLRVVPQIDENAYDLIFTFDTQEIFDIVSDTSKIIVECHTPYKQMRGYLKSLPKNIAGIASPSQAFMESVLLKEVPEQFHDRLFVLPNFSVKNPDENQEKQQNDQQPKWDEIPICYVGRMDSLKNTKELFKIFAKLNQESDGKYILVLAGNVVAEYMDLEETAKEFGIESQIHYLNSVPFEKVDELLKLIKQHRGTFVSTSLGESFGLSALEAMENEIPVLLTDIPCHKALVEGDNDFLYEAGNIEEAVLKIVSLFDNYEELGQKVNKYSQNFNSSTFVEKWEKMLENIEIK